MCYVVIAGGPNKDLKPLLSRLSEAEKIICADSGADALVPFDIVPDVVWGDMDSISAETKEYLVNHPVFLEFPCVQFLQSFVSQFSSKI